MKNEENEVVAKGEGKPQEIPRNLCKVLGKLKN